MIPAVRTHDKKAGFAYWAQRTLEECDKASHNFAADPVHDLRVAIRRCRSMADGFLPVDPDPAWKQMKRLGKPLFSSLGDLRDTQVMMEWVTKLSSADDHVAGTLLETLRNRETELKLAAQAALNSFDRKRWAGLGARLARRAQKIPLEGPVFQLLALERWQEARELHRQAIRNRTQAGYHALRIGIKRFRYTLENFLPQRHERWARDLRDLQDALGEVHDFDVLWAMIKARADVDGGERERWHARILAERDQRLALYRAKMLGKTSLWHTWRAELPSGSELEGAALEKFRLWASFLDPDPRRSANVERISMALYDTLAQASVLRATGGDRRILQAAAVLHDIGRSKRARGHQKRSFSMVRKMSPPPGWTPQDMQATAIVARLHQGPLLPLSNEIFNGLAMARRSELLPLAGILRLAVALVSSLPNAQNRIVVQNREGVLHVSAEGLDSAVSRAGERIAKAKYLLEASCRLPIVVSKLPETARAVAAGRAQR